MENEYWNKYYKDRRSNQDLIPSQFATFVAGEILTAKQGLIVEVGCGNGRDALFFARHNFDVLGIDASVEAIDVCRTAANGLKADFIVGDVDDSDLLRLIQMNLRERPVALLYSRFFLHAVSDKSQTAMLDLSNALCKTGALMALEFRTVRDKQLTKETESHFRRFIDPLTLIEEAYRFGFRVEYFVEGFGYAKYRGDDAHVARVMLRRQ
jgi:SAM-dependent methyltransferase